MRTPSSITRPTIVKTHKKVAAITRRYTQCLYVYVDLCKLMYAYVCLCMQCLTLIDHHHSSFWFGYTYQYHRFQDYTRSAIDKFDCISMYIDRIHTSTHVFQVHRQERGGSGVVPGSRRGPGGNPDEGPYKGPRQVRVRV